MTSVPSHDTVAAVARTRPLLERRRGALQQAIGRYIAARARTDQAQRAPDRGEAAGEMLLSWLLDRASGAGSVEPAGSFDPPDYARFGDGLAAVLKDQLGAEATPALLAAWGDTYWAGMRAARPRALALAA